MGFSTKSHHHRSRYFLFYGWLKRNPRYSYSTPYIYTHLSFYPFWKFNFNSLFLVSKFLCIILYSSIYYLLYCYHRIHEKSQPTAQKLMKHFHWGKKKKRKEKGDIDNRAHLSNIPIVCIYYFWPYETLIFDAFDVKWGHIVQYIVDMKPNLWCKVYSLHLYFKVLFIE